MVLYFPEAQKTIRFKTLPGGTYRVPNVPAGKAYLSRLIPVGPISKPESYLELVITEAGETRQYGWKDMPVLHGKIQLPDDVDWKSSDVLIYRENRPSPFAAFNPDPFTHHFRPTVLEDGTFLMENFRSTGHYILRVHLHRDRSDELIHETRFEVRGNARQEIDLGEIIPRHDPGIDRDAPLRPYNDHSGRPKFS